MNYFRTFPLRFNTIERRKGADFAPEYLYGIRTQNNNNIMKTLAYKLSGLVLSFNLLISYNLFSQTTQFPQSLHIENFNIFYNKFDKDSLFQVSRIKFPVIEEEAIDSFHSGNLSRKYTMLNKIKWNFISISETKKNDQTIILKTDTLSTKDTTELHIYIPESDALDVIETFIRIDGEWFMLKLIDSTANSTVTLKSDLR